MYPVQMRNLRLGEALQLVNSGARVGRDSRSSDSQLIDTAAIWTAHSLPHSEPVEPPGQVAFPAKAEPSHHSPIVSVLADNSLYPAGSTPEGEEASFSCVVCPGKSAAFLAPGTLPGREKTVLADPLASQLSRCFTCLQFPYPGLQGSCQLWLSLFHLSLFLLLPTPPYSILFSVQFLREWHSLPLCRSSDREVGSRLRSLGEKPRFTLTSLSVLAVS